MVVCGCWLFGQQGLPAVLPKPYTHSAAGVLQAPWGCSSCTLIIVTKRVAPPVSDVPSPVLRTERPTVAIGHRSVCFAPQGTNLPATASLPPILCPASPFVLVQWPCRWKRDVPGLLQGLDEVSYAGLDQVDPAALAASAHWPVMVRPPLRGKGRVSATMCCVPSQHPPTAHVDPLEVAATAGGARAAQARTDRYERGPRKDGKGNSDGSPRDEEAPLVEGFGVNAAVAADGGVDGQCRGHRQGETEREAEGDCQEGDSGEGSAGGEGGCTGDAGGGGAEPGCGRNRSGEDVAAWEAWGRAQERLEVRSFVLPRSKLFQHSRAAYRWDMNRVGPCIQTGYGAWRWGQGL